MVDHPARRADDEIATAGEAFELLAHARTTVDGHRAELRTGREFDRLVRHLECEFAGGAHDEADWAFERMRPPAIHERYQERGGLAGAGLGLTDDIGALHRLRNHGGLNGCRVNVTRMVDGVDQRADQFHVRVSDFDFRDRQWRWQKFIGRWLFGRVRRGRVGRWIFFAEIRIGVVGVGNVRLHRAVEPKRT